MTPKPLFEFHGGLHLKDTLLWMDATRAQELCFVSHAKVGGALDHQKIITTEQTAALLWALTNMHGPGRRTHEPQSLVTPYCRPFSLGQLSLELFPSGHVLGAASLLVEHQGLSIVYSGEINPRQSRLVDRLEARHCDVLALSNRFGQRRFVFPPFEQLAEGIVAFAADTLRRDQWPVFFCEPLGEAQEVASMLLEAGVSVRAHRQVYAASRIYRKAGPGLEGLKNHKGTPGEPAALLWPLSLRASPSLKKVSPIRTAFVSGLAIDPAVCQRMGCDASFALSCHADYAGLLEYVRACQPEHVVLVQGNNGELRKDLFALGMTVSEVGAPLQMDLF